MFITVIKNMAIKNIHDIRLIKKSYAVVFVCCNFLFEFVNEKPTNVGISTISVLSKNLMLWYLCVVIFCLNL